MIQAVRAEESSARVAVPFLPPDLMPTRPNGGAGPRRAVRASVGVLGTAGDDTAQDYQPPPAGRASLKMYPRGGGTTAGVGGGHPSCAMPTSCVYYFRTPLRGV